LLAINRTHPADRRPSISSIAFIRFSDLHVLSR
jgi:hypothetical protein